MFKNSSFSKLAWGGALLAANMDMANAGMVSGKSDATTTVKIFENIDTTTPKAKQTDGTTASTNELSWSISNLSWIDEDTAETYLEITNTLTAPILATDKITFHVEFTSSQQATLFPSSTVSMKRDVFECSLEKDVTDNIWKTTVKD